MLVITILFLIILFFNKRRQEQYFYEYQDKIMSMQLEEINHIYMTMREWRHDYHNHMQKIRAHLALNELKEVNDYIDQMETQLNTIDLKYKTGNTGIDAILNSKLTLAEENGLEIGRAHV